MKEQDLLSRGSRRRDRSHGCPIFVLTGFLGSGKTTLLRALLAHPEMNDTVVLINELGEVALDHLLMRQVTDDVVLLRSGCLCCSVRDDLVSTLADLNDLRSRGEISNYSRVVVETTGLADPAPVVQTLMDSDVGAHQLSAVITTIDCTQGYRQLTMHVEAARQLALADRVVFTKTDLADENARSSLRARVQGVAPSAELFEFAPGHHPLPAWLFADGSFDIAERDASVRRWIEEGRAGVENEKSYPFDPRRHDSRIATFTIAMSGPLGWKKFMTWIELLLTARGEQILRFKGLVNITGENRPVVIQGVQHVLYPPEYLTTWPDDERCSRLVFVTQDLSRVAIENSMRSVFGPELALLRTRAEATASTRDLSQS